MGLPEKLLADGERPLVVLRPHARRLARPALILLVLAPLAAYAAGVVPPGAAQAPARTVVVACAALIALRWVVWPFLRWWNTVYVLTDERIFERQGVLRRSGHDLPLQGVSDVVVAQRFSDRLLRCGTLRVVTEGGGEIVLPDIPAISLVQSGLLDVTDDITERLRAARADPWTAGTQDRDLGMPGHEDGDDAWVYEEHDEHDEPTPGPSRRDSRRRDRETARRLADLQAQVRRTPTPDSPLEDEGVEDGGVEVGRVEVERIEDGGVEVERPAAAVRPDPGETTPEGARILRFPRRP